MPIKLRRSIVARALGTLSTALLALSSTAALAETTVKIGVLTDMSGAYADPTGAGSVWAAKKAIADYKPETKGVKVEFVFADHQNKPDVGVNIARQWIDVDHVDAIVDVPTSSVALAVSALVAEKNKVMLASGPSIADLTGKACTPNTIHWSYDSYGQTKSTASAVVKTGGDSWFFLTVDYAGGHILEKEAGAIVLQNGGKVLGSARHPFPAQDFSSFLLQAQASKAKIIGLANAGADTINAIKQAAEFGITQQGQQLAALVVFIPEIHALGLKAAQGLVLTASWYWDLDDNTRAFAKEFAPANNGRRPSMVQAGVYSAVTHYLKAVTELKQASDGKAVVDKMKAMPTDDPLFGKGTVRADGRKIHDLYLFEVKKPEDSKYPWDYYKIRSRVPAAEAWRPLNSGACPLIK
ncbi:MAG: ABC transporter substrate-binding protein [Proteobacteria bacterium]|nr:ABC transporter substrate-binding protein [Pseudomonadota bacterium]